MFQRTSSAAYAHMGKSKRDWQTGGPIRREYVHGTAYGYNINRRTCTSMWVELEGANQILHISKRGQSTYVFAIRARIDWFCIHLWFAHCICVRTHVRMHVKGQIKCTNFMPGANQNARNPSQKCAWKWFGRIFWGFLEKINTTCTRWYRCQTIWNRNNKKPQNSN